jgi:hypothetical protein
MKKTTLIIFVLLFAIFTNLYPVTYQEYNPNDERFRILALEKAKIRLELSERNWQNAKSLYDQKMIARDEFLLYELQYKNDRLNYEQYLLSVIFDNPYIIIEQAYKITDENGEVFVDLKIKNSSGGNVGIQEYVMEDMLSSRISITEMFNLYVSIKDLTRNIISQPYEYHIRSLGLDASYSIRFRLLKDVESVIVSTNYGDKISEKQIYLTRRHDSNLIMIRPDIYAQEIENGQMATFRLAMEYFGDTRQTFTATLNGLPEIFTWDIHNLPNQVTLSRLVFSPAETHQNIGLRIRVPERVGDNIDFDKPIPFNLTIRNQQNEVAGVAELQIVPTGRVSMRMTVNNLFWRGNDTEEIRFAQIRLENDGMQPITNIATDIFLPAEWDYTVNPSRIEILNPGERIPIELTVKMNKNVMPGIYQIRFRMTGNHVNRNLQTPELEFRAEVVKKTNAFIITLAILLSLAVIVGTIWFVMKISRN